ncbi:hypothetical protein ACWF94_00980 [Streptomyces sp. NPDC055078]
MKGKVGVRNIDTEVRVALVVRESGGNDSNDSGAMTCGHARRWAEREVPSRGADGSAMRPILTPHCQTART